jgi:hypothetical protein
VPTCTRFSKQNHFRAHEDVDARMQETI